MMIKLLNFFLLSILLQPFQCFAQNQQFGIRAGVNASKIFITNLDSDIPSFKPLPAYHISGLVKTELNNKSGLQTELSYTVKGFAENNSIWFRKRFHYLTLPVLLNYKLSQNILVTAGLEPSYFLNYQQCIALVERRWDVCADSGFEFRLSSLFSLGLRYNHGLIPVNTIDSRDSQGQHLNTIRFSNRTLQVSLSYEIAKKN
ncbi:PorT family protein [Dyadobacter flavalbus]|uniref:PorT family protein n=1 Tax=Dyadobacter flavalbus TaxID=2579942 RepID=A0A5M8QXX0_9BACT|nr:porin family protein [Dyadobacter flavalbus]KAA6439263.1 PorT family protein [Dyadobacter flavalbus]